MISLPLHGSLEAPRIARNAVLSRLEGRVTEERAFEVALVVSELVTNSVLHADLGAEDTVLVEIALGDGRLAITVTDPGSDLEPRLLPRDPTRPHGFGLHLVNDISTSWGVRRNPGALQVWCELALGESGREPLGSQHANRLPAQARPGRIVPRPLADAIIVGAATI